jgi:hypothetical protein
VRRISSWRQRTIEAFPDRFSTAWQRLAVLHRQVRWANWIDPYSRAVDG